MAELEKFFQNDDHKGILIQWKEEKFQSFELAVKTLRNTTTKSITDMAEISKCDLQHRQRLGQHEQEIFQKAGKLADEWKEKSVDDGTLDEAFNQMWDEWIGRFTSENSGSGHDIPSTTEQMICESFPESRSVLDSRKLLSDIYTLDIKMEDILTEHSRICKMKTSFKTFFGIENKEEQWKMTKVAILNNIDPTLRCIVGYLNGLMRTAESFKSHFVTNILKRLREDIKKIRSHPNMRDIKIRPSFEARLAVHVFCHAIQVFEEMQKEYDDTHSLAAKMKQHKQATRSLFKNKVKQCTDEVIFADLVCDNIERLATKAVRAQLATAVVKHFVSHFGSKHNLIKAILGKLARDGNFKQMMSYVVNARYCAQEWLKTFTEEFIFGPSVARERNRYMTHAERHTASIMTVLEKNISKATDGINKPGRRTSLETWLTKVFSKSGIALSDSDKGILEGHSVTSFVHLQKYLYQKIPEVQKNILAVFARDTATTVRWNSSFGGFVLHHPSERIRSLLWGCDAQCPLCEEPCQRSDSQHVSETDCHQCIQHRPAGVAGWRWGTSGKLVETNCSYDLHANNRFRCRCPHTMLTN